MLQGDVSVVDIFVEWPMPLVWLMAAGLICSFSIAGRGVLAGSVFLLIVSAMPIVGETLLRPLSWGSVTRIDRLTSGGAKAVLVPTAGSFRDGSGRWWPEEGSILRLSAGLIVGRKLHLPTIVAGGSPRANQPAEASTVRNLVAADTGNVIVVPEGRDSAETARALKEVKLVKDAPIILVTHHTHIARMRAALRRHGIAVAASIPVRRITTQPAIKPKRMPLWRMLVPSDTGLDATGAAVYEYVGIAWYLATGRIRFGDL